MDVTNNVSDLSSELSELDSEKEFADFDPATMQLQKTYRPIVPKASEATDKPSALTLGLHRNLELIFWRARPYAPAPTNANMREMRDTLLLILAAWCEVAGRQASDKQEYQHEALRAADPGNDGVDNISLLTAKVLNDALEEAEWGFNHPPSEWKLEDHPINRTMQDMELGMRAVLSDLEERLQGDLADHEDQGIRTSRNNGVVDLRPAYVPATGRQPTIPQLNDSDVILATNREDVEQRSSNHPCRMDAESRHERELYAQRVHELEQRKMQYAFVARDAAMKRRRQFRPNALMLPPPGLRWLRTALPPPQQQTIAQPPRFLPQPQTPSQGLRFIDQSHEDFLTPRSTDRERRKPRQNFNKGDGPAPWGAEESLLMLQLRRDHPTWKGQQRVEELNRQMGKNRTVDGMTQHAAMLIKRGKTLEVLEKEVGKSV